MTPYRRWCKEHGCDHGHCPICPPGEHPQPFLHVGELYCGRCEHVDGALVRMVPCTPENCGD